MTMWWRLVLFCLFALYLIVSVVFLASGHDPFIWVFGPFYLVGIPVTIDVLLEYLPPRWGWLRTLQFRRKFGVWPHPKGSWRANLAFSQVRKVLSELAGDFLATSVLERDLRMYQVIDDRASGKTLRAVRAELADRKQDFWKARSLAWECGYIMPGNKVRYHLLSGYIDWDNPHVLRAPRPGVQVHD